MLLCLPSNVKSMHFIYKKLFSSIEISNYILKEKDRFQCSIFLHFCRENFNLLTTSSFMTSILNSLPEIKSLKSLLQITNNQLTGNSSK